MGLGSRGRVVPDGTTSIKIKANLKRAYVVFFLIVIPIVSIASQVVATSLSSFLEILASIVIGQFAFTNWLAYGLERSPRRMTLANQSASVVANHSLSYIYWMIALSVLLCVLNAIGFLMPPLSVGGPEWLRPVCGFGAVFFAGITVIWVRTALAKRRTAAA